MNALILGRNSINAEVQKNLSCEGIDATVLTDASQIIKFKGEPGNYTVTTPEGKYSFSAVIITEPPQFEGVTIDSAALDGSGLTMNIMDDDETGKLDSLKTGEKIVILLDYTEETPEYITAKAISLAKRLAEKKKEIVFLSKVVKSGYGDNEQRYREARNSGVNFIKYEKLTLGYDEETDVFTIEANDGVFGLNINTPFVLSVAGKDTPELENISRKLRLYDKPGSKNNININDDRFFLYPVFTTRRGIYYLNPAVVISDTGQSVKQAIPSIIEDMTTVKKDGYQREIIRGLAFPEVDPAKCAFCYSCYRTCPHGALEPDIGASAMKVIESECQACGACIAVCPGEAIKRKDFTGHLTTQEWSDGKGRCKIYCCENGAAEAFKSALPSLGEYAHTIDCENVACGGSVSTDKLAVDFRDYETVIIACCIEDACRHIDGDRRACKQSQRTAELLQKAGLKDKRIAVIKASAAMSNVVKDNILKVLGVAT